MLIQFIFLIYCCIVLWANSISGEVSFDNFAQQWEFIVSSIKSSPDIKCNKLPNAPPGAFFANGETKHFNNKNEKLRLMEENCVSALNSLLELHIPRNKRQYSFKFSNQNNVDEIIRTFCAKSTKNYGYFSGLIQEDRRQIHDFKNKNELFLVSDSDNHKKNGELEDAEENSENNSLTLAISETMEASRINDDISKSNKEVSSELSEYGENNSHFYDNEAGESSDKDQMKFRSKTPKILNTILRSILEDIKEDLPFMDIAITKLPKSIRRKIIKFFRQKDIESILELISELPRHTIESFVNNLELEAKRIHKISENEIENFEFFVPHLEDEWRAIIEFMSESNSPVQIKTKNRRIKEPINIPKEFKYSNGIKKKFVQFCRRAIRSLSYEKYVSDDGIVYYGYNENNTHKIVISGNDSDERKAQVEVFCYMVYEKLYANRDKELMKKRHIRALEKKRSWEEGGIEGVVIDELLKGFSNEVNDERLQWLFLVKSASTPNSLVYSTDLPTNSIPVSFTNKPTEGTIEITGKIRFFVYNCRTALMTLGVEKYPGSKFPLYKVQLGTDNIHGLIRFCKSVAQRYMGRLVEWFNIIQASLEDEVINLIDENKPGFRCPDYFEYEDDTKLVENCSKAIMMMIDENNRAERNGKEQIWTGLKIKCPSNHVRQHIQSFCKSVAYERPDIRIATIKELSESGEVEEQDNEKQTYNYDYQQQAIESVEERLKIIEGRQVQDQSNNVYKLDKWNQLKQSMIENRKIREKLDKYSRMNFQRLFDVEDTYKESITSILNEDEKFLSNQKKQNIQEILDQYSSDLLSMRTEWSDLLFQISNNNRKITEVEIEIMGFVHQALDYTAISHRIEIVNSLTMVNMANWESDLALKEKDYINVKMEEYNKRLDCEQKIQKIKDLHLKRRQMFEKHLYRILPRRLWNKVVSLGVKGLYPVMPMKISDKELQDRKTLIVRLQEEKNHIISKYDAEGQKLTRELLVVEKVINKHLAELNEMWDSTYSIEYSIQWELRVKDMQDTYIYLNNEYNRYVELVTRQQLRQSQLQSNNPQYQELLKETNQALEISTTEMKKILKLMNDLREKRNELDSLVESDMSKSYAEKINALRRNSKLLEESISKDIDILQKKNQVNQLQINRDIKYYEITNFKTASSERLKKHVGLIEANLWINTKNNQLNLDYESRLKDDLNSLTYLPENSNKINQIDFINEEEIPQNALSEIKKFKEQLKMKLFNVETYNNHIFENDMEHIRQFEDFDSNIFSIKQLFESEGGIDDGTLYNELSTAEWNFIQSRWVLLKMKHFFVEKKEELLIKCAEMRNSLDKLMNVKFGMIPVTKPKKTPSKAEVLIMKGIGMDVNDEQVNFEGETQLTYDEKVLKLVKKRLEDANSVLEQELSTRLNILDEKIREGRIRLYEAARDVVSNWELQQSTAAFRFASPQNKDRMREVFVKERDKVTREEIKKTRPFILEKHILLQQQKDRALQFKRDIDWIYTPGRVASQLMKFEKKIRVFSKKKRDHYEKTLNFLIYQAEKVDKIKQIDEELNNDEIRELNSSGINSTSSRIEELKKDKERLEVDLALKRREYQLDLSSFQSERDALYDVTKNLKDEEDA